MLMQISMFRSFHQTEHVAGIACVTKRNPNLKILGSRPMPCGTAFGRRRSCYGCLMCCGMPTMPTMYKLVLYLRAASGVDVSGFQGNVEILVCLSPGVCLNVHMPLRLHLFRLRCFTVFMPTSFSSAWEGRDFAREFQKNVDSCEDDDPDEYHPSPWLVAWMRSLAWRLARGRAALEFDNKLSQDPQLPLKSQGQHPYRCQC